MPAPTNTESIRTLERQVAVLEEQVATVRSESTEREQRHTKTADALKEVEKKLAVLDALYGETKRGLEEGDRKRWQLTVGLILAILGVVLNAIFTWLRS